MGDLFKFLSLEEEKLNWKIVLLLIMVAYAFNIAVRYIYISYIGDIPQFYWNGHLMINNNDGYYWAEGARDILSGIHQKNDLSPINMPASILTATLAKFFVFIPLDVLIEYLPGFLGSLVVIPVILIGRALGSTWLGFLASLLAGMAWSYYHRTMFGYYDTDMLVVVFPTFALWAIIWSIQKQDKIFLFLAPFIEILMIHWHGGLYNIATGFFIMSFIYILIFSRNKENLYLLILLLIPLLRIEFLYQIVLLVVLYLSLLKVDIKIDIKYLFIVIGVVFAVLVAMPWISNILNSGYFTRASTQADGGFKYFSVVNTVSEAIHIDKEVLIHRISGGYIGFVLGIFGYILLAIRYPIILISLPMVVLGLFALRGGLRFTIFAVPFFALGDAYIAYLFGKFSYKLFEEKKAKIVYYVVSLAIMFGFIYPNYKHIHQYIMPTVFTKDEIMVLNKLRQIASRDDYVVSWWDYGYPIRYYADVKTLIDGAKHSGDVNFPVSFALTRDLLSSRNMAVLDVYFTEYNYNHNVSSQDYLKSMMKMYGFKDPNDFLDYLSTNIKLPPLKEDIYYYLPLRMLKILPIVAEFSEIDLKTSKMNYHYFKIANNYKQIGNEIILGKKVKILLNKGAIIINKQIIPIKKFAMTSYDQNNKLHVTIKNIHKNGLNIIFMRSYNKFLIMDDFFFNSAYIQLFVLENTQGLFEKVILTPYVKVYKVKK